jgi:hypothetical protein
MQVDSAELPLVTDPALNITELARDVPKPIMVARPFRFLPVFMLWFPFELLR